MDRSDPRYRLVVNEVRELPQSRFCFLTGEYIQEGCGDPAHILPVSLFPEWADKRINIVIVTRKAHRIIDQGTAEQIARLPKIHNWLARMKGMDEGHYQRFYEKLEPYLTAWH